MADEAESAGNESSQVAPSASCREGVPASASAAAPAGRPGEVELVEAAGTSAAASVRQGAPAGPAISFDDVSFSYDGEHDVLRHVSLDIARGSYVVVLGHNGSGKSTLARHMNALLTPDSGTVRVMGMDTSDPDEQIEIRRHAGMVFQNPDNQMVTSIVADDVAFGPENLGVPQPEIVRRVDAALDAVAMTEFARADPTELSGGQKQRVSIAGMLAMEPDILVFDEPCAMLDPRGRRGVRRVMRELNDRGLTIVHITHFMEDALEADAVHVMDGGRVVLSGAPDEVFAHGGRLRELGLEQPFAMRLAHRLRELGVDVPDTPHLAVLEDALCPATPGPATLSPATLGLAKASVLATPCPATLGPATLSPARASAPAKASAPASAEVASVTAGAAPAGAAGQVAAAGPGASSASATSSATGASSARVPWGDASSAPVPVVSRPLVADGPSAAGGSAGLLVFDHVTYHYGSEVTEVTGAALKDVSLRVGSGEFVAVIGHTGSGKSTLAEHCNGTKLPSSGTVSVCGIATSDRRRRRELRRLVGFVAQYPEYQLFAETVRQDVGFGPRNLGMSDAEVDAAVREALDVVGLSYDDVAEASPFDLSGGQKRRVALAGIIAMHPRVLALDEPMVGLDPQGRREVFGIVRRLHEQGTTIVMVSHSMEDVAEAAQRVVVLNRGEVVDEGDPATVFSHGELLHRVGLDVPLPARTAADLEARGWDFGGEHPLTLDDLAHEIAARAGVAGANAADGKTAVGTGTADANAAASANAAGTAKGVRP